MPSTTRKPVKNDQLLTDRQVAERLNVSVTTVRKLRYDRHLPTVRVAGCARTPLSAVENYIAARTEGAKA
jgi:excisionase family DNA binding protein